MHTVVNKNNKIYYTGQYWNDFPKVLEYICEKCTGDKNKWWIQDFKERFAQKPFRKGLFINCGNGWVERDFIDRKIVKQADAFDYSNKLLNIAERKREKRSISYFQADVNNIFLKANQYDLIVNVAAIHHVQYINRLCYNLATALKENGIFVNYDYIGPHRNQYTLIQWVLIHFINKLLPKATKQEPLCYPHLPTMLVQDPTEAIHSELIIKIVSRYFDIVERHNIGGGIAYPLLTHNPKLKRVKTDIIDASIDSILKFDNIFTKLHFIPSMFSYFIAKPNIKALENIKLIKYYQRNEKLREKKAENFGNIYYQNIYYLSMYLRLLKNSHFSIILLYFMRLPLFLFSFFHLLIIKKFKT